MPYFLDTYALIEILRGNPGYAAYKDEEFVITQLNLIEMHYAFLKIYPVVADMLLEKYSNKVIMVRNEIIKSANRFRRLHKREKFSTADCIGYCCAKENRLVFVTGDEQFRNLSNVEFMK